MVLRERDVFKREETDEVFMPTTITMSNDINRNPELRKQISFTKTMKSDDVEDLLKKTFPVLANTERFYCAKAVQKEKLDFCGERRIWSGEVLNREIKGHSVLYIYCEEDQIQDSNQFSTDSGQSGADDLQEQTRTTTLISQFESVKISEKDEVNKTSHKQALMETFTAKGSQSYPQLAVSEVNQQYTCATGIPPSFLARHTTDLSLLLRLCYLMEFQTSLRTMYRMSASVSQWYKIVEAMIQKDMKSML